MEDDPNRWYRDALARKHEAELHALAIAYWAPRACLGVIVLLLGAIAVHFW